MADNTYRAHVPMDTNMYNVAMANISTSPATVYIPVIAVGKVIDARIAIANAITSASAVITIQKIPGGTGTAVTLGTITVTVSGSGAGATYAVVMSGTEDARTVNAGDSISIATDGGSSTSCAAVFTVSVDDF